MSCSTTNVGGVHGGLHPGIDLEAGAGNAPDANSAAAEEDSDTDENTWLAHHAAPKHKAVKAPALPPNWLPIVLWIVGVLLVIVAFPVYTSKTAFWTMTGCGIALAVIGTVLFVVYARRTEAVLADYRRKNDQEEVRNAQKRHLKRHRQHVTNSVCGNSLAETSQAAYAPQKLAFGSSTPAVPSFTTTLSAPPVSYAPSVLSTSVTSTDVKSGNANENGSHSVTWMDKNKPEGPLSAVKQFRSEEPVLAIRGTEAVLYPDHVPKPVPAKPMAKRATLGYEKPYACPADAAGPNDPLPFLNANGLGNVDVAESLTCKAPMFYTPPSQYPTVDDIATERQRFWSRPETPETDRARREGMLQEAAFLLGPPNYRSMVPIAIST